MNHEYFPAYLSSLNGVKIQICFVKIEERLRHEPPSWITGPWERVDISHDAMLFERRLNLNFFSTVEQNSLQQNASGL